RHEGPSTLKPLLAELLSPYPALDEGRLTIEGDDMTVDDRTATPIGLVFHELATNSAKYGALSAPEGKVQVVSRIRDGRVRLDWRESGGPPISRKPELDGFGTRLTDMSIVQQLGGTLRRDWRREGLIVEIELATAALNRD